MRRTLVTKAWLVACSLVIASAGIANAQDAAQVKKGEQVYAAQKCSVCHAIAGKGEQGESARRRRREALGRRHPRSGSSTRSRRPPRHKSTKKPPMPAKYGKLPAADLDALVAYMQSLK